MGLKSFLRLCVHIVFHCTFKHILLPYNIISLWSANFFRRLRAKKRTKPSYIDRYIFDSLSLLFPLRRLPMETFFFIYLFIFMSALYALDELRLSRRWMMTQRYLHSIKKKQRIQLTSRARNFFILIFFLVWNVIRYSLQWLNFSTQWGDFFYCVRIPSDECIK